MAGKKWYVVWNGVSTGVFDNWADCEEQVKNYPGAKFRSYPNQEAAVNAYRNGGDTDTMGVLRAIANHAPRQMNYDAFPEIRQDAIAVDAACSKNPGPVEYRGVWVRTGQELFRVGPFPAGTNNIGEYLALVHALALLDKKGRHDIPIYSDSRTAQSWVRNRRPKTTLTPDESNTRIREVMERATRWLLTHEVRNPIIKWDTEHWGEIPADFGRKH